MSYIDEFVVSDEYDRIAAFYKGFSLREAVQAKTLFAGLIKAPTQSWGLQRLPANNFIYVLHQRQQQLAKATLCVR